MKTEEDEAFDEIARKQGHWGGGFMAKRAMAADKLQEPWNEDEWRRNNWRCGHGWLRGEQCEICNAPQPAQEPVAQGSKEHLKIMMEHSAWDDRLELSDALANIDEFYATAPPKREWVGLTEEEIDYQAKKDDHGIYFALGALWAEAKLKDKNA